MPVRAMLHRVGWLLAVLAAGMVSPAIFALMAGEEGLVFSFTLSAMATAFCGVGLVVSLRGISDEGDHWVAVTFIGIGWLVLPFFAALPLLVSGVLPRLWDAYFEAMSALTTTGATLISDPDKLPVAILVWRAVLEWLGGLGTIVMASTVFASLLWSGIPQLSVPMPWVRKTGMMARLGAVAAMLWPVYAGVTALGFVALLVTGVAPVEALCLALSSVSTGGMLSGSDAVSDYGGSGAALVVCLLMVAGGTTAMAHQMVFNGRWRDVLGDAEFRAYSALLVAAAGICVLFVLWMRPGDTSAGPGLIAEAAFLGISLVTTTGWALSGDDGGGLGLPMAFVLLLPAIGGMALSTAGGLKVARLVLLIKYADRELARLAHPSSLTRVRFGGYVIAESVLAKTGAVFLAVLLTLGAITLAVSAFGVPFEQAIAASLSVLSNCGPAFTMALDGAADYTDLPRGARTVLCAGMALGRLEVLALLSLFNPAYWQR